ncbi:MAG: hypothetical protein IT302_02380 [Dehalococcoidia bacterium]|nr:hypothetical protein [Dehalococcoidia bacterium]
MTTMTSAKKKGGLRFPVTRLLTAAGAVVAFVALWGAVALQGAPEPTAGAGPAPLVPAPAVQSGPANAVAAPATVAPAPVQRATSARRSRSS